MTNTGYIRFDDTMDKIINGNMSTTDTMDAMYNMYINSPSELQDAIIEGLSCVSNEFSKAFQGYVFSREICENRKIMAAVSEIVGNAVYDKLTA